MLNLTHDKLLEKTAAIRKTLENGLKSAGYADKIAEGALTVADISQLAGLTGELISYDLRSGIAGLTADDLPLGEEFFTDIIPPMMKENYDLLNTVSAEIQKAVDESQAIKIASQSVAYPAERVETVTKAAGLADDKEKLDRLVTSPVENISQSYADEYVKTNAEYRTRAGLKCYIVRKIGGSKCCKWCASLAGQYVYGEEPHDVYRRHDNCGCTVTYINGRTATNVWTKTERTYDGELLEENGSELHVLKGEETAEEK